MVDEDKDDAFAGSEPKSSAAILSALKKAEVEFLDWNATCGTIDDIYNLSGNSGGMEYILQNTGWQDAALDLFWSSFEIMKPAVYARPPVPAVAPLFKDNDSVKNKVADVLERSATAVLALSCIDEVMCEVRDDLIFTSRGVIWLSYESDGRGGGQRVNINHKDRMDFRHEPARKWQEVGWVAAGEWLTRADMRKRFRKTSGDAYKDAKYATKRDDDATPNEQSMTKKCRVWEVWHKADKKVYWVTEGVDVLLDSDDPHLKLSGFFPCPRPAYATLKRRSLVPVPDWQRYAIHFRKISDLTRRIYMLLDDVRMKGLIPAGGDIGDAVEQLIRSDDDRLLVPVPGASFMAGSSSGFVSWLPLTEIATAIQGLIQARSQLIDDFYQLSGISDIMRGATESDETLGAQQLKSQYGSVRVRGKIDELQRVAAETVHIAAEIIAENFTQETILKLCQMDIPTQKDIEKRIDDIEDAAKAEMEALGEKAKEMAQQPQEGQEQPDPAQAKQMYEQAQQQIIQKYSLMLEEAQGLVSVEDVMELLRDDKVRSFTFEVESDSTILTDELQEKQSRNEFMGQFTQATQGLMSLAAMGEEGAELVGEMLKFSLAPYRVGRQLEGVIERWVKVAPEYAAQQAGSGDGMAEANKMLGEAEMEKAKAATMGVEARAQAAQAEMQRKMMQMEQDAQDKQMKAMQEQEKLRQQLASTEIDVEHKQAQINKLTADTAKILHDIDMDVRRQDLSEYQAAETSQNTAMEMVGQTDENGDPVEQEPNEVMSGLTMLGEMMAQQGEALGAIAAIVAAPTELVRDDAGRPVGARKVI